MKVKGQNCFCCYEVYCVCECLYICTDLKCWSRHGGLWARPLVTTRGLAVGHMKVSLRQNHGEPRTIRMDFIDMSKNKKKMEESSVS